MRPLWETLVWGSSGLCMSCCLIPQGLSLWTLLLAADFGMGMVHLGQSPYFQCPPKLVREMNYLELHREVPSGGISEGDKPVHMSYCAPLLALTK